MENINHSLISKPQTNGSLLNFSSVYSRWCVCLYIQEQSTQTSLDLIIGMSQETNCLKLSVP